MFRITMLFAIMLYSVTASAATWMTLDVFTATAIYFFDADTVIKKDGTVTIWEKMVQEENSPDTDGSYSTAVKMVYFCKKRTSQGFAMTTYDKSQNFIKTYSIPAKESDIVPGSVGEDILKFVCANDFPKNATTVAKNDIYAATKRYFDYLKAAKNDPAPK